MNAAQLWSIVAIMAAGLATMITLVFGYVGARFDTLTERLGRFEERFDVRLARVEDKFDARLTRVEQKFDARFDHLDRDMQRVIERVFP